MKKPQSDFAVACIRALLMNKLPIVCGGGWKQCHRENVKVKAWISLFAAILPGGVAVGADLSWLYIPAAIGLVIALVLFVREKPRPIEMPDVQEGGDLRKLYGTETGRQQLRADG